MHHECGQHESALFHSWICAWSDLLFGTLLWGAVCVKSNMFVLHRSANTQRWHCTTIRRHYIYIIAQYLSLLHQNVIANFWVQGANFATLNTRFRVLEWHSKMFLLLVYICICTFLVFHVIINHIIMGIALLLYEYTYRDYDYILWRSVLQLVVQPPSKCLGTRLT